MAKVLTDSTHYTDIAAAIRAKNGSSATYKPSEMADAISAMELGEGGGGAATGDLARKVTNVHITGNSYTVTFADGTTANGEVAFDDSGAAVSLMDDYGNIVDFAGGWPVLVTDGDGREITITGG